MAKLTFHEVHMKQFKGALDSKYEVSEKTDIIGKNGSGKTTVGTAFSIPFTGKSLDGRSNPEIHNLDLEESEPSINIKADIDGKPIDIGFIQVDQRTKKQKEENAPVRISNKYFINSVAKSRKAFESDFSEKGINLDLYEQLTNTSYVMNLTEEKRRNLVFEMIPEITDLDVAKSCGDEVSDVTEKLKNYTLLEVISIAKQQKKKASERLDAIPEQIIGLEKGKPEIENEAELTAKRQRIEATIEDFGNRIKELDKLSPWTIDSEITSIEAKQKALVISANAKRQEKISKVLKALSESKQDLSFVDSEKKSLERQINFKEEDIESRDSSVKKLLEEYEEMKGTKFPDNKTVCPTCGQKLPKDEIDKIKAKWQKDKDFAIAAMKTDGNNEARLVKKMKTELASMSTRLAELDEQIATSKKLVETNTNALSEAEAIPVSDGTDIPEWKELEAEKESLKQKSAEVENAKAEKVEILTKAATLKSELSDIDRELGKRSVVEHIDREILSLKEEQKTSAQAKADAERILYHCQLISQKKNEMLSESVNSKFPDYIRFKLFDTLKNGEIVNCCKPEIRNENGEWKELGKSANNALEMRAKIAILEGFQNFHNMHIPIIIDNAECLDSDSKRLINANTQLIFLTVVDDIPLTVNKL